MNYYSPNYYGGYSGGAQYQQQLQPPMSQQVQPQMQPTLQMPQALGLNGKIVDGEEMVKATEVPIGGYGIFPKADMSEIFIKTWNSNGTTSIVCYRPYVKPEPVEQKLLVDNNASSAILDKINQLECKIDTILSTKPQKEEKKKQSMTF